MLPEEPPTDPIPEQPRRPPDLDLRTVLPPAPLPQAMAERYKGMYWAPRTILRAHLLGHSVIFYLITASLVLQPERYTIGNLPSLVFALGLVPIHLWSAMFALVATLKLISFWRFPLLSRVAAVSGLTIVLFLTLLFGLAWLWGPATVFLFSFGLLDVGGHVFAICHIDGRRRWREPSS